MSVGSVESPLSTLSGGGVANSSSVITLLPSESPRRLVVGVPVTIHLLSTLSNFAKGTRLVDKLDETWPSSIMRRFHRICRNEDTPAILQVQLDRKEFSNRGHLQGGCGVCSFRISCLLDSAENPRKKNQPQIHDVNLISMPKLTLVAH